MLSSPSDHDPMYVPPPLQLSCASWHPPVAWIWSRHSLPSYDISPEEKTHENVARNRRVIMYCMIGLKMVPQCCNFVNNVLVPRKPMLSCHIGGVFRWTYRHILQVQYFFDFPLISWRTGHERTGQCPAVYPCELEHPCLLIEHQRRQVGHQYRRRSDYPV